MLTWPHFLYLSADLWKGKVWVISLHYDNLGNRKWCMVADTFVGSDIHSTWMTTWHSLPLGNGWCLLGTSLAARHWKHDSVVYSPYFWQEYRVALGALVQQFTNTRIQSPLTSPLMFGSQNHMKPPGTRPHICVQGRMEGKVLWQVDHFL
jgi:hypothetical protein